MLVASEGVMVPMLIVVLTRLLVMMAEVRVVLKPVRKRLRNMRPLMKVQYAEGVKGQDEGERHPHVWQKYILPRRA